MTITLLVKNATSRLGALGLAAGLALGAGSSMAAPVTAGVSISNFTVTTSVPDAYVWAVDSAAYQSWEMTVLNGGGLYGASAPNFYSANNLSPVARLAQTSLGTARGDTQQFTDSTTQLTTYGFNLEASATPSIYPPGTLSNSANATALQSGGFTLIDAFGNSVAGDLVFTLYYELDVSATFGSLPGTYAQALLNLLASDDAVGNILNEGRVLNSYESTGGTGSVSGFITWTSNLAVDQASYYTLSGTALANAIPEPGAMLLAATSLLALALTSRRRKPQQAAVAA